MNDGVRHALVEVRQYARDRRREVSGSSSEKGVAHELDLLVAFVDGLLVRHRNRPTADSVWAEPLPPNPGRVPTPSDGHAHDWHHTTGGGAHDYCVTCGLVRWPGGPTCPICGATHEHAHGDAADFPVRWRP